jgi:hypothetical protein
MLKYSDFMPPQARAAPYDLVPVFGAWIEEGDEFALVMVNRLDRINGRGTCLTEILRQIPLGVTLVVKEQPC